MWKLVGTGSRKGASLPSRGGDVLRQPVAWAMVATGLALTGPQGRKRRGPRNDLLSDRELAPPADQAPLPAPQAVGRGGALARAADLLAPLGA